MYYNSQGLDCIVRNRILLVAGGRGVELEKRAKESARRDEKDGEDLTNFSYSQKNTLASWKEEMKRTWQFITISSFDATNTVCFRKVTLIWRNEREKT